MVPSALGTAGERFFQTPTVGPSISPSRSVPAASTNPLFNIDSDTLSSGSNIAFTRKVSPKLQASAILAQPLSTHFSIRGRASVFAGKSEYYLPVGAGLLVDPTTIKFVTTGVEIEAGLAYKSGSNVRSVIELGAGQTHTDTRTRINSALLDVSSASSDRSSYIYTAIEVGLPVGKARKSEVKLRTTGKFYPEHGGGLQTGIVFEF